MLLSTGDLAAAMVDQVDLTEAGAIFGPVSPGADWDTVLQQGPGLGESPLPSTMRPIPGSQAIHRRWADFEEFLVARGTDGQATGLVQAR